MLTEICTTLVALFIWDHVGRIRDWQVRPYTLVAWVVTCFETFFNWVGIMLGKLGLILEDLFKNFQEVLVTLQTWGMLLVRFVSSPVYILWGYIEAATTYLGLFLSLALLSLSSLWFSYFVLKLPIQDLDKPDQLHPAALVYMLLILGPIIGFIAFSEHNQKLSETKNLLSRIEKTPKTPPRRRRNLVD